MINPHNLFLNSKRHVGLAQQPALLRARIVKGEAMQIIEKKVSELIPYENNPRRNDDAVKYVANSIKEFGMKVPLVIDKNNVVITGHTRLKACKKLGIKKVPCIIADDLTEDQIKAFRLADNKVAEKASWDYELLDMEIEDIEIDLEDFGFEFEVPEEPYDTREHNADVLKLEAVDLEHVAGKWFCSFYILL